MGTSQGVSRDFQPLGLLASPAFSFVRRTLAGVLVARCYADKARYTDAFDSEVCCMISGTVFPAFRNFFTFLIVSEIRRGSRTSPASLLRSPGDELWATQGSANRVGCLLAQ